jgi:hypothetical protein
MKVGRCATYCNTFAEPRLRFESQRLTSFAGLVLVQQLFAGLKLKHRINRCFDHLAAGQIFPPGQVLLQRVVHLLLGFRSLGEQIFYRHDPMVQRLLGLSELPTPATLSRQLQRVDERSLYRLHALLRNLALERLMLLVPARITIDFDGLVQSTKRRAEDAAAGYTPKKKGQRSYYPLFATIAQTAQVLDFLHRSGNVHDSRGARDFILDCIRHVRAQLPHATIEGRMDAAFFSDDIVQTLSEMGVEFTLTVPFERFPKLKDKIEGRTYWHRLNHEQMGFEQHWKPKAWTRRYRFVFICQRRAVQRKGPIQLDLFELNEAEYEYKVVVTNKTTNLRHVLHFHEGRGQQENLFGQISSQCHMQHVPLRNRHGNELYLTASVLSHNLLHELQMRTEPRQRHTNTSRTPLWRFWHAETWRARWLHRAGRFTRPQGKLTLTISGDEEIASQFLDMADQLNHH